MPKNKTENTGSDTKKKEKKEEEDDTLINNKLYLLYITLYFHCVYL